MSNLFYSGSGRHTSGAFTVTMKDGAKLAKADRQARKRGQGSDPANRIRLQLQSARVGIEGNPPALRS